MVLGTLHFSGGRIIDSGLFTTRTKKKWHEVRVYYTADDDETPEVIAKFRYPGDARVFAKRLQEAPEEFNRIEIV